MRHALKAMLFLCIALGFGVSGFSYTTRITVPEQFSQTDDPRIEEFETSFVPFRSRDKATPQLWSIFERMEHHRVPGLAIAVIENGETVWARGYGTISAGGEAAVDAQTMFSMGSVSKVVNAALILRVSEDFNLDLDADVNTYLTSWKVPENEFTAKTKVTLRMLLAHTTGFDRHGFADFDPDEPVPTALQTLDGLDPAKHDPVRVKFEPGTAYDYSGGGTTVIQVLIEDVTGLPYTEAAKTYIFDPLGMTRSTFENPLPETYGNIARSHNIWGQRQSRPRGYETMPEMAASGLWTNADDMAKFIAALLSDDFMPKPVRDDMFTLVKNSEHGLGPKVYDTSVGPVFSHGGANDHYRTWLEGHPEIGSGVMIMTNGTRGSFLRRELRMALGKAFDWPVRYPEDFED
ncbi:MAG: serine hydrolase domain-containing protein [Pseudomonadota bacterium]